jgi:hypothetical protein
VGRYLIAGRAAPATLEDTACFNRGQTDLARGLTDSRRRRFKEHRGQEMSRCQRPVAS